MGGPGGPDPCPFSQKHFSGKDWNYLLHFAESHLDL